MATAEQVEQAAEILGIAHDDAKAMLEKAVAKQVKLDEKAQADAEVERLTACHSEIQQAIADILTKHTIVLGKRRIVARQNDGGALLVDITHTSRTSNGGGKRNGAPARHGKAQYKGKTYNSPSALAKELGLKVEGMRDMVDVFERGGLYKVERKNGKFIVKDVRHEEAQ